MRIPKQLPAPKTVEMLEWLDAHDNRLDGHDDDIEILYKRPVDNLLINSNFTNPVNQRGITEQTEQYKYIVDRWFVRWVDINGHIKVTDDGIELYKSSNSNASPCLNQRIENGTELYNGKILTFSIGLDDGTEFSYTHECPVSEEWYSTEITKNGYTVRIAIGSMSSGHLYVEIYNIANDTTVTLAWAKLEVGEVATPYVPRLYAEELQLCQRYYERSPVNPYFVGICWENSTESSNNRYGIDTMIPFKVEKRIQPTITLLNEDFSAGPNAIITPSIYTNVGYMNYDKMKSTEAIPFRMSRYGAYIRLFLDKTLTSATINVGDAVETVISWEADAEI